MKKVLVILVVLTLLLSCSDLIQEPYDITFINNTEHDLIISDSYGGDFEEFSISAGETKIIESESSFVIFDISGSTGDDIIDYTQDEETITLFQYEYLVEYKIKGNATSVNVTLNNPSGGTEQYSNVFVPHTYSYKEFSDDFLYISAQNQGDTGSVTVEIYYKGELYKTSTSSGAYVIATASGSK